jgi:hypothetical protein
MAKGRPAKAENPEGPTLLSRLFAKEGVDFDFSSN